MAYDYAIPRKASKSFLKFEYEGKTLSGKTKQWRVANRGGSFLGTVSWYAPWRKYCFEPLESLVFDAGCLREIAAFCELETREQRAGRVLSR